MEASFATPSSSNLDNCENVMTQPPLFTAADRTVQHPLVHYALLEQETHLASESNHPAAESRVWTRWGEVARTSYQGISAYTVSFPLPTSKKEGDGEGETPPELSGYGYTRFRGGRIKPVLRDALGYRPESAFWTFRDVKKGRKSILVLCRAPSGSQAWART
ncbi:hypothetical protein I316_05501 [Kwoniella heveanensis BCC8398]|uniref:Uncharacterized protein n=1 Tax=Kwoniella heveanensis BCC8398 TaxID=1296120 RepID=A0A1B9GP25_9TREE|nr:hypothetical protein I316_05501 [Kwoniella heveanensis BCC8398]